MKIYNLLILFIITLFFTSCGQLSSEDVNPDVIYTNYLAKYDAMTGEFEVSADFTVGGNSSTYIELVEPSKVFINNQVASKEENILNQIFYKYKSNFSSSHNIGSINITYIDSEQRVFSNNAKIPNPVIMNINTRNIEVGEDLIINYSIGDTSDGANTLYLYIRYPEGGMNRLLSSSNISSGSKRLSYHELERIHGKTAHIYLCRSKINKAIRHPGEGGSFKTSYCTVHESVFIKAHSTM